jgi:hypothetical protein
MWTMCSAHLVLPAKSIARLIASTYASGSRV